MGGGFNNKTIKSFNYSLDSMLILTEIYKNPKYHVIYYKFLSELNSNFSQSQSNFFKSLDHFFNKIFVKKKRIGKFFFIKKKRMFGDILLLKFLKKINSIPYSFCFKRYSYNFIQDFSPNFSPREDLFNENPKNYLYNYCTLFYPYLNVSFFNFSTNLLSELNFNNFFLLCLIHKKMFNVISCQNRDKYNRGDYFDFDEYESYYYRNNLFENDETYFPIYAERLFNEIYDAFYQGIFKINYPVEDISFKNKFLVNFPVKNRFLERKFFSIYDKNKSFLVRINSIRTYLPIHLYNIKRNEFFKIVEDANNYTFVYYYLLSEKERNFFKTNIFSYYSKNMGIMSTLNFKNKANF